MNCASPSSQKVWIHLTRSLIVFWLFCLGLRAAHAGEAPFQPICDGYNPRDKNYNPIEVSLAIIKDECPAGMGIIFHRTLFRANYHPEQRELVGNCCALPEGALGKVLGYFPAGCPEGSLITGAELNNVESARTLAAPPRFLLQCTELNKEKFHVGPALKALNLDYGEPPPFENIGDPMVPWRKTTGQHLMPRSIVRALGRTSKYTWLPSGCVGFPWGSFMTRMGIHNCRGMEFRQIFPNDATTTKKESYSSDSSTNR